jgi:hypothetical protein
MYRAFSDRNPFWNVPFCAMLGQIRPVPIAAPPRLNGSKRVRGELGIVFYNARTVPPQIRTSHPVPKAGVGQTPAATTRLAVPVSLAIFDLIQRCSDIVAAPVSGLTIRRTSFQPTRVRCNKVQKSLSVAVRRDLGRFRLRTASCWGSAKTSIATSRRSRKKERRAMTSSGTKDTGIPCNTP